MGVKNGTATAAADHKRAGDVHPGTGQRLPYAGRSTGAALAAFRAVTALARPPGREDRRGHARSESPAERRRYENRTAGILP